MGPVGQFLITLGGGVGVPVRGAGVVVATGGIAVVRSGALGMLGVVAAVEAVGTVGTGGPAVGTVGMNAEMKRSAFDLFEIPCMWFSEQMTFSYLAHEPKSGSKFNPSAQRRRAISSPFTHTR